MRWAPMLAVVFFGLVLSVVSADSEEPRLKIMARSSVYNVGEKKGIYCEGTNVPEQIEWINPDGKVVEGRSTKNMRVYVERRSSEPNLVALIIHSTKLRDTGNWTCQSGSLSENIEIIVGEKVMMATDFEEIPSEEGKTITLSCEAKGTPTPVVQWYKEQKVLEENPKKYKMKNDSGVYTLEIRRLDHADAGEYMCKVTQKALSHYTHKIIKLEVRHRPILFNPESKEPFAERSRVEHVFAVLNETKDIVCSAFANPPPKFTWFRRKTGFDKPIREDKFVTSEETMTSTLTVDMTDAENKGEYKCVATNEKGSVSTVFDVIIAEKPSPPTNITRFIDADGAFFNATHMYYTVSCDCTFQSDENGVEDPSNLPIIGFSFQATEYNEEFPPDWEKAEEFQLEVKDPEVTRFDVGPLPSKKKFHVRVRSYSKAGFSDWVQVPELGETSSAIRLISSLLSLVTVFTLTMCF